MGRFDGRVVLVTGGSSGIGYAAAKAFLEEGAKVAITGRDATRLQRAEEELARSGTVLAIRGDVAKAEDARRMVTETTRKLGPLDVLVNNAGIVNPGSLRDYPLADWRRVIDVNLTGTFLGMQATIDSMIDAGGGSIINISSIEGMAASPFVHGYVASKFAVRGITKSAAIELAPHRIRVNSIHPGLVHTPMSQNTPDGLFPIPLGRIADAEELSAFVVFLASDLSSYATGTEFVVDGGLTSQIPSRS